MADSERLASVEAKLEFLKELLLEVKQDIKGLPTKDEYEKLDKRIKQLEDSRLKDGIKIGIASGMAGFISAMLIKLLMA